MILEDIIRAKLGQSQKDKYCIMPRYWTDDKAECWLPGVGGKWKEIRESVCNGAEGQVEKKNNFGDVWKQWLYNSVNIFNALELYTWKWLKSVWGLNVYLRSNLFRIWETLSSIPSIIHTK